MVEGGQINKVRLEIIYGRELQKKMAGLLWSPVAQKWNHTNVSAKELQAVLGNDTTFSEAFSARPVLAYIEPLKLKSLLEAKG